MQIIDLFSGIGGFSLAGHWAGWRTVHFCEISEPCHRVLRHHFPGVPIHNDVKTFGIETLKANPLYSESEPTVVVGGFPCQPYSLAGKRQGKNDERHLFPEMLRIIREVRPEWVVGENVYGLVNWNEGMVFDEVCADLENEGFEVWPVILPACGLGAPHKRDRVWFIAHSVSNRNWRKERRGAGEAQGVQAIYRSDNTGARQSRRAGTVDGEGQADARRWRTAVDPHHPGGCSESRGIPEANGEISQRDGDAQPGNADGEHDAANASIDGSTQRGEGSESQGVWPGNTQEPGGGDEYSKFAEQLPGLQQTPPHADNPGGRASGSRTHGEPEAQVGEREHTLPEPGGSCDTGVVADADEFGWQRSGVLGSGVSESSNGYSEPVGNVTHPASQGLQEREYVRGDDEQEFQAAERGGSEWLKDYRWEDFPTVSPVCQRDDGVSVGLAYEAVWGNIVPNNPRGFSEEYITFAKWRRQSIQQLGNSIVPQVAYSIFDTINKFNKEVYGSDKV